MGVLPQNQVPPDGMHGTNMASMVMGDFVGICKKCNLAWFTQSPYPTYSPKYQYHVRTLLGDKPFPIPPSLSINFSRNVLGEECLTFPEKSLIGQFANSPGN